MRALVADVVDASCVDGPGNRYVVFLQGCSFRCVTCHNPHTISPHPTPTSRWVEVDDLAADIARRAPFLSGVTVSGGEATLQWEAVRALFQALAADPATALLTRLVDSNGDCVPEVWEALAPWMHGAMVDLKALDPVVHRELTGRSNGRVLCTIRQLTAIDRLTEVRLLIVPGVNDDAVQVAATARWLAALDPVPPVVVQGFRHEGTRPAARRYRPATTGLLEDVAARLVAGGLPASLVRIRGIVGAEPAPAAEVPVQAGA